MNLHLLDWMITNERDLYIKMDKVEHGYNGTGVNPYHEEGSILTHTKMVLEQAKKFNNLEIFLVALLHDIGKTVVYEDNHETKRRIFVNHESVSFFMANDILDKLLDSMVFDKKIVLFVIAKHGSLYNYMKNGRIDPKFFDIIASMFSSYELKMLRDFFYCDHLGRICTQNASDVDNVMRDFNTILDIIEDNYEETQTIPKQRLTLLVGPPRVGKSTYVAGLTDEFTLISRDNLVMKYGTGDNYSEKWKSLSSEDQKGIDVELQTQFNKALKDKENILVDMTNMSKKSRKKWVNNAKGYYKKAVVFVTSKEVLMERMTPEKNIPEGVIDSMIKSFVYPDYTEFDHIKQL